MNSHDKCKMCNEGKSANSYTQKEKGELSDNQNQEWSCSQCTLKNKVSERECSACGVSNPFFFDQIILPIHSVQYSSGIQNVEKVSLNNIIPSNSTTISSIEKQPIISSTPKRKTKCGACGQEGHNRGNYTPDVCLKYFDPKEVEIRNRKKEREEEKKRSTQQRIEQLEDSQESSTAHIFEIQRMVAKLERAQAAQSSVTESELKRLRKAKARAEKQAQKYA
eukprot:CAMPEP_0194142442 /NCGR_PEP_ID=MMETSP0152-20130528/11688_1 /TAXON_ID=1049557 /ORGANISM="Thalassiothrix antarctica, Strain L6-D1" /LENGTH=221 /DNA_ID=CAMNT_0038841385 /DNA_START=2951 /DNA_END=3616 /DNA_ORIENTATION=-